MSELRRYRHGRRHGRCGPRAAAEGRAASRPGTVGRTAGCLGNADRAAPTLLCTSVFDSFNRDSVIWCTRSLIVSIIVTDVALQLLPRWAMVMQALATGKVEAQRLKQAEAIKLAINDS